MRQEVFKPVVIALEADGATPVDPYVATKSQFLSTATSICLSQLVCPAADDINTDGLGRLLGRHKARSKWI